MLLRCFVIGFVGLGCLLFCFGFFFFICIPQLRKLANKGLELCKRRNWWELHPCGYAINLPWQKHMKASFSWLLAPMTETSTPWHQETALISNMLQDGFHCPCLYLHLSLGRLFWCKPLFHHSSHHSDWTTELSWTKPTASPPWDEAKTQAIPQLHWAARPHHQTSPSPRWHPWSKGNVDTGP